MEYIKDTRVDQLELSPQKPPYGVPSPITDAKIIARGSCYVYCKDRLIFIIAADDVIGHTPKSVTVRSNHNVVVYDSLGQIVSSRVDWS